MVRMMIDEIRKLLKGKKREILNSASIEAVVLSYLNKKYLNSNIPVTEESRFQDEEKLAVWGYTSVSSSEIATAKQELPTVLGKKKIKVGTHYSDRPLLLGGLYLLSKNVGDVTSGNLVKDAVDENLNNFGIFDQFLLYSSTETIPKIVQNYTKSDLEKKDVSELLTLYILCKKFSAHFKLNEIGLREILTNRLGNLITDKDIDYQRIFLLEYFISNETNRAFKFREYDAKKIVKYILSNFSSSIFKIVDSRRKGHSSYKIDDEYDVQDLLYTIFKPIFQQIIDEDYTPKLAGSSKRIDLVIPNENIVIEVKYIRKNDIVVDFIKQLNEDVNSYQKHPNTQTLYCFVYDPFHKIVNKNDFYELNGERVFNGIKYNVDVILS